jgi:hypothetical protein
LFKSLEDHENFDCPEKLILCSNEGCLVFNDARKLLKNHKLNDCLFQPVKCPFFITGCGNNCNGFVLRNNFQTHIADSSNTSSAIISASKKTIELENKFLIFSTKARSKAFILKLLDIAKELDPTEEILLKKWIELFNNNKSYLQYVDNAFRNIIVENFINNGVTLKITNTIIFEFKIPKNFTENDDFESQSHKKVLHEEINGNIGLKYFKATSFFGVYLQLENFKKESSFNCTLFDFNGSEDVSMEFSKKKMERSTPRQMGIF